jgi:catalase
MDPEEAIDRIAAGQGAPAGHRVLHAKGDFYSGTFNASPEATALCRAGHLQGESVPVLVRWSHGSGRPDANDDMPFVRGMSVSFVLPDGTSTDLLGQTIPRFPVRTPEDFVRLTEVARDRRELAKFVATRPRTALALAANARARTLAAPRSYAEATYFPVHAYRWLSLSGHGTWVRYRLSPRPGPRPPGKFSGRDRLREEILARLQQGPVAFDLVVTVAAAKDDPHNPMSVWRGSREFVAGWFEITTPEDDHEAEGDLVVFDPTRVVDGIELSDDPILRFRPSAYSVSIERRSRHP